MNLIETKLNLSPITKRRVGNFISNRRAYISFWIFLSLFLLSLGAEFIANDKPILIHYRGKFYFPIFKYYPETVFGGDFDSEADYHDPYIQNNIKGAGGWMLWPIIPYKFDTIDYELKAPAPAPPSARHWLGTDDQGHDVVALIIYGFRISVLFGLILTFLSSFIGIAAGAIQGYFGGIIDLLFQRFLEIWSSLPALYILIILTSIITPTFGLLLFILLLFRWTSLVGVVRAEFLRARNYDFVRAAKALGVKNLSIMFRHILHNAMVSTLTFLPFILNGSLVSLTSLDFLGLGLPPEYPSLGRLLAQGMANLQAPWLGISSFIVLAVLLSLLIFIGEGVRDAFDPRKNFT